MPWCPPAYPMMGTLWPVEPQDGQEDPENSEQDEDALREDDALAESQARWMEQNVRFLMTSQLGSPWPTPPFEWLVDPYNMHSDAHAWTELCKPNRSRGKSRTSSRASTVAGSTTPDDEESPFDPKSSLSGAPTTLMVRNIPNGVTRESLLKIFNEHGFAGCYDLVYLPVDFKTHVSLGYAFCNFVSHEFACAFCQAFHGFSAWPMRSGKVCNVSWSEAQQGIAGNVEKFRNSPVMHESVPDEFKPVLFRDGVRVPFPEPTKRISKPRPWSRR